MDYDFIIVGAGSAGCVLAERLSKNPASRVLLLEAGGRDWHPNIHIPAGFSKVVPESPMNWSYETQPEPEMDNRRLYWPRGKVLGGSSSINAMCYCRGHPRDYEDWAATGCDGWDWSSVLPAFRRVEDQQRGASDWHGVGGELKVQDLRYHSPLSERFIAAGIEAGFTETDDFNGPRQKGFGFYQVTQDSGRRCSAARAFLGPARSRPNLTIQTGALVHSLIIEAQKVTGVRARLGNRIKLFMGERVILSGGAINSPQLLMLSGIGPASDIRDLGIEPVLDLPGVGQNLQDHLDVCTLVAARGKITYDHLNELLVGLRYIFTRNGPASSNIAEAGAFISSPHATDERPDIQLHFVPALLDDHGRNTMDGYGMTIHACSLRPTSRGEIRLASVDPAQAPLIRPRYMSTGYDRKMMLECARIGRNLFRQPAFADIRGEDIYPEPQVSDEAGLMDFIRRKAESIYHPIGTCKMGVDDMAVVDPQLRVRGMENLYVVDASVMPSLVSGNTNAPTIMIAERFADLNEAGLMASR